MPHPQFSLKGLKASRPYYYLGRGDLAINYQTGEIAPPPLAPITNSKVSPSTTPNNYGAIASSDEHITDTEDDAFVSIDVTDGFIPSVNPDSSNAPFFIPYHLPSTAAHLRRYMISPFAEHTSVLSYTLFGASIISQWLNFDEQDPNEHLSLFILIFFLAIAVDIAYHIARRIAVHTKDAIFIRPEAKIPVFSNLIAELRGNLQQKAPAAVNRGLVIAFIIAGYFLSLKKVGYYAPLYEALYATIATVVMHIQKKADSAFLHFPRSILCDAFYKGVPVATIGLIYSLLTPLDYIKTGNSTFNDLAEGFILSLISMLAYSATTLIVALIDYVVQDVYLKLTNGVSNNTSTLLKTLIGFTDSVMLDVGIVMDNTHEKTLTQHALPGFIVLKPIDGSTETDKKYAPEAYSHGMPFSFG